MTKFNAQDALETLDYDFRPYADAAGTVPEPSDDQVAEFYADLGNQFRGALGDARLEGFDVTDPYDVGRLLSSLNADEHRALYDRLLGLHADVCGGKPSREDLEALPFRLRRAFYGMVQGWLRPEASRPATSD